MRPVDVAWVEELPVCDIGIVALDLAVFLDLLIFTSDIWRVAIAFAVDQRKDLHALFPAILASQPARRLWKEDHADEE